MPVPVTYVVAQPETTVIVGGQPFTVCQGGRINSTTPPVRGMIPAGTNVTIVDPCGGTGRPGQSGALMQNTTVVLPTDDVPQTS